MGMGRSCGVRVVRWPINKALMTIANPDSKRPNPVPCRVVVHIVAMSPNLRITLHRLAQHTGFLSGTLQGRFERCKEELGWTEESFFASPITIRRARAGRVSFRQLSTRGAISRSLTRRNFTSRDRLWYARRPARLLASLQASLLAPHSRARGSVDGGGGGGSCRGRSALVPRAMPPSRRRQSAKGHYTRNTERRKRREIERVEEAPIVRTQAR